MYARAWLIQPGSIRYVEDVDADPMEAMRGCRGTREQRDVAMQITAVLCITQPIEQAHCMHGLCSS